MRMFWSVLAVIGALSAPQASAANWDAPDGLIDHERHTVWQSEGASIVLAKARKPAKGGAALAAFDGRWSVIISTRSGNCDPQYRFGVRIINGNIVYEGGGAGNARGRVSPSGVVAVSVSSGPPAPAGQGRLSRDYGIGSWHGQGPAGVCSGTWQAWHQG
jgi:hypothetical protein